jgi:hypothetical protein
MLTLDTKLSSTPNWKSSYDLHGLCENLENKDFHEWFQVYSACAGARRTSTGGMKRDILQFACVWCMLGCFGSQC